MGYLIQQSSTARPLYFFMVQSSDHITGLTGASPTVTICKNGGSFAAPAGAITEVANGWYKVAGNATDTGTTGPLLLHATASSADPLDDRFEVVAFNPDDGTHLGLAALPNTGAGASSGIIINGSNTGSITLGACTLGAITAGAITVGACTLASYTNTGNDSTSGNVTVTGTTTLTGKVSYGTDFTINGGLNVITGTSLFAGVNIHGTSSVPGVSVLGGMQISNPYGDAVNFHSTYTNGNALSLQPSGTGSGILGTLSSLSNNTLAVNGSGVASAITAVTGELSTMLTPSGSNWTYTSDALKNGPTSSGSDPWSQSLPAGYTGQQAGAVLARLQTGGSGNVAITAASDATGGLYAKTSGGAGIADITVIAYYATDFRSGNLMNPQAQTLTAADGSWVTPMLLTHGTSYTFVYFGLAGYQTTTYQFTVA